MEEKYGNSIFDIWRGITAGRIMYLRSLWLACDDPGGSWDCVWGGRHERKQTAQYVHSGTCDIDPGTDPWGDTLVLDLSHGEKHRNYRMTGAQ